MSSFARAGGVLVGSGDGGVDADVPGDQAGGVGAGVQAGQDPGPGAVALPAAEQAVDGLPCPVAGGHVPPGGADPGSPSDPVDELAFGPRGRAARLGAGREQWFQDGPLCVGEVKPAVAGIGMVVTRSPGSRSSWSKYQLPETSLLSGQQASQDYCAAHL
jgi:hypothetical protein